MLERLRLIDFKSFADEQVELAPLTLLVGANASGKSNVFDAIQFLSHLGTLAIPEILDGEPKRGGAGWTGLRGGGTEATRAGRSSFSLESTWRVGTKALADAGADPLSPVQRFGHKVTCQTSPSIGVVSEILTPVDGPRPYRNVPITPEPWSGLHPASAVQNRAAFADAPWPVWFPALREQLGAARLVDIQARETRGYGRLGKPLGPHGENLSGVLAELCAEPETRRGLVDWLAELCAPELSELDFIQVPELDDVMAMAVEADGRRISVRSWSDGTLRFLGLLLALRTAERGACLLIEEVDAGLHPTRIRLLVEYLELVTRERGIQVIATTHAPEVLRCLSDAALHDVVLCAVVPGHEGSLLRRLADLPHLDDTLKRKGIDELFSTGWLELVRRDVSAWLEARAASG